MLDKLYGKYFQKSKSFLYPLLGIKKNSYASPIGTYISLEGKYEPEDMKLICTYKKDESKAFKDFEEQMLITNPLFLERIETSDFNIYVFDLDVYYEDYINFLLGRYSKLSNVLKKTITAFYGEKSPEYKYIDTYLYPNKYFETYASLLDVTVETLKKIGELCDQYDVEKEKLIVSLPDVIKN